MGLAATGDSSAVLVAALAPFTDGPSHRMSPWTLSWVAGSVEPLVEAVPGNDPSGAESAGGDIFGVEKYTGAGARHSEQSGDFPNGVSHSDGTDQLGAAGGGRRGR